MRKRERETADVEEKKAEREVRGTGGLRAPHTSVCVGVHKSE